MADELPLPQRLVSEFLDYSRSVDASRTCALPFEECAWQNNCWAEGALVAWLEERIGCNSVVGIVGRGVHGVRKQSKLRMTKCFAQPAEDLPAAAITLPALSSC